MILTVRALFIDGRSRLYKRAIPDAWLVLLLLLNTLSSGCRLAAIWLSDSGHLSEQICRRHGLESIGTTCAANATKDEVGRIELYDERYKDEAANQDSLLIERDDICHTGH